MPYMIMTADVRPEHRQQLPAVTHINGSARVQTVSAKDNAEFHLLLQEVGKRLGREMVLNTSFNVKGQPIVNTPQEAIKTFLGTGIEYLFLENNLVSRRERAQPNRKPELARPDNHRQPKAPGRSAKPGVPILPSVSMRAEECSMGK